MPVKIFIVALLKKINTEILLQVLPQGSQILIEANRFSLSLYQLITPHPMHNPKIYKIAGFFIHQYFN